jgi:hypothetical protein
MSTVKANPKNVIHFHFYSLEFFPYKRLEDKTDSNTILKDVITYITTEKRNDRGHLIDRNRERPNEESRELFMTNAVFMYKERRIRCSIALLRTGKKPQIKPIDKFKLIPMSDIGTPAEVTHFFIDFSKKKAVLCVEYNYHGPRVSDIEYYLRNVAHDTLKLSKKTDVNLYMETPIDDALSSFRNVLNIDIKMNPKSITQMDNDIVGKYYSSMVNIDNVLKPKFIKIEAMFQTSGRSISSSQINRKANGMFREMLNRFKGRPHNKECFENFVVKYEDKEGKEEVFNLLKGKKEIEKEVDLSKITRNRHWYELIEEDFNEFVDSL